jgi:hypothetical protein
MSASLIGRLGVKHFQTIRRCGVDVTHGLVLLFGIGARALPSWDSKTRWSNLMGGLAVSCWQVQADMRTHLIHRPARDIIPPLGDRECSANARTALWNPTKSSIGTSITAVSVGTAFGSLI